MTSQEPSKRHRRASVKQNSYAAVSECLAANSRAALTCASPIASDPLQKKEHLLNQTKWG